MEELEASPGSLFPLCFTHLAGGAANNSCTVNQGFARAIATPSRVRTALPRSIELKPASTLGHALDPDRAALFFR
jgi:hypothetical protein